MNPETDLVPSDWEDSYNSDDAVEIAQEESWNIVLGKKERRRNRRLTLAGPRAFDPILKSTNSSTAKKGDSRIQLHTARELRKQGYSADNHRDKTQSKNIQFNSAAHAQNNRKRWDEEDWRKQTAEEIKRSLFGHEHSAEQALEIEIQPERGKKENMEKNKTRTATTRNSPIKIQCEPSKGGPFPFGSALEDILGLTRPKSKSEWLWIRRGKAIDDLTLGLGFPATKREIVRFGGEARRFQRSKPPTLCFTSYKEAVQSKMSWKEGPSRPRQQDYEPMADGGNQRRYDDRDRRDERRNEGQQRQFRQDHYEGRRGMPPYQDERAYRGRNDLDRDRGRYDDNRGDMARDRNRYEENRGDATRGRNRFEDNRTDGGKDRGRYDEHRGGRDVHPGQDYAGGGKRHMEDRDREQDDLEKELRAKLMKNKESEGKGRGQSHNQNEWGNQKRQYYEQEPKDILCYNCNKMGHHQGSCGNPPFCYSCRNSGHKAMACPLKKGLQLCGFGFQGAMFHSISLPANKRNRPKEVMGLMTVTEGIATEGIVIRELQVLIDDKFQWVVKELDHNEFLITFPNEAARDSVARFKSFAFQTDEVIAKVQATDRPAGSCHTLQPVWVKAYNWHPDGRTEDIVREVAYMVGKPIQVDLKSLGQKGPIRVKVAVWDPSLIYGETNVVFDLECRKIKWVVERETAQAGPSKDQSKDDNFKDDKEDDDDYYDDLEEDEDIDNKDMEVEAKEDKVDPPNSKTTHKQTKVASAMKECQELTKHIVAAELTKHEVDPKTMKSQSSLEQEKKEMQALEEKIEAKTAQLAPWLMIGSNADQNSQDEGEEFESQVIDGSTQEESQVGKQEKRKKPEGKISIPQPAFTNKATKRKVDDGIPVQDKAEARKAKINDTSEMDGAG